MENRRARKLARRQTCARELAQSLAHGVGKLKSQRARKVLCIVNDACNLGPLSSMHVWEAAMNTCPFGSQIRKGKWKHFDETAVPFGDELELRKEVVQDYFDIGSDCE